METPVQAAAVDVELCDMHFRLQESERRVSHRNRKLDNGPSLHSSLTRATDEGMAEGKRAVVTAAGSSLRIDVEASNGLHHVSGTRAEEFTT